MVRTPSCTLKSGKGFMVLEVGEDHSLISPLRVLRLRFSRHLLVPDKHLGVVHVVVSKTAVPLDVVLLPSCTCSS